MKIVVVAGGLSHERDVSLASGSLVANALIDCGYEVVLVDVYKGLDIPDNGIDELFITKQSNYRYEYKVPEKEPDLHRLKQEVNNGKALIGQGVIELCQHSDLVFIALHGAMGENGQIQATFDALGITYTGTNHVGSVLAMDKDLSKRLLKSSAIPTAEWVSIELDKEVEIGSYKSVGFPCVVKPCNNGSSIGVYMVNCEAELKQAFEELKIYEDVVMIEQMIKGREFSVGILGDKVLPVIEIIPKEGFYDYKNKYQMGKAEEICPAELSDCQTGQIQSLALKVHQTLKLGDYSRVDFILDTEGQFICLEANTLPGMTPTSLLPQEALAIGIDYERLCSNIVELAKSRNNQK